MLVTNERRKIGNARTIQILTTNEAPLLAGIAELVGLVLARMVGEVSKEVAAVGRVESIELDTVEPKITRRTAVKVFADRLKPKPLESLESGVERLAKLDRVW